MRSAHRIRPVSTAPLRQEFSFRGFGFLQARHLLIILTRRLATPRQTSTVDTSFRCLPLKLLDYEYPYSLVPGASKRLSPLAEVVGFGTHHVAGGAGVSRHLIRSASAGCIVVCAAVRGMFSLARPMRPTSDIHVASPAPVFDEHHAFAWTLLGKSRQTSSTTTP